MQRGTAILCPSTRRSSGGSTVWGLMLYAGLEMKRACIKLNQIIKSDCKSQTLQVDLLKLRFGLKRKTVDRQE